MPLQFIALVRGFGLREVWVGIGHSGLEIPNLHGDHLDGVGIAGLFRFLPFRLERSIILFRDQAVNIG